MKQITSRAKGAFANKRVSTREGLSGFDDSRSRVDIYWLAPVQYKLFECNSRMTFHHSGSRRMDARGKKPTVHLNPHIHTSHLPHLLLVPRTWNVFRQPFLVLLSNELSFAMDLHLIEVEDH
jgi:hypothetical protein